MIERLITRLRSQCVSTKRLITCSLMLIINTMLLKQQQWYEIKNVICDYDYLLFLQAEQVLCRVSAKIELKQRV